MTLSFLDTHSIASSLSSLKFSSRYVAAMRVYLRGRVGHHFSRHHSCDHVALFSCLGNPKSWSPSALHVYNQCDPTRKPAVDDSKEPTVAVRLFQPYHRTSARFGHYTRPNGSNAAVELGNVSNGKRITHCGALILSLRASQEDSCRAIVSKQERSRAVVVHLERVNQVSTCPRGPMFCLKGGTEVFRMRCCADVVRPRSCSIAATVITRGNSTRRWYVSRNSNGKRGSREAARSMSYKLPGPETDMRKRLSGVVAMHTHEFGRSLGKK